MGRNCGNANVARDLRYNNSPEVGTTLSWATLPNFLEKPSVSGENGENNTKSPASSKIPDFVIATQVVCYFCFTFLLEDTNLLNSRA